MRWCSNPAAAPPKGLLALFESAVGVTRDAYSGVVRRLLRLPILGLAILVALGAGSGSMMTSLPAGFLPLEDNGYVFVDIQLPDAATVTRTEVVSDRLNEQIRALPGVANTVQVNGFGLLNGQGSNSAMIIVNLEGWDERPEEELSADGILAQLYGIAAQEASANVIAFNPPPITGLGVSAGVEMKVQQTGGGSASDLSAAVNSLVFAANQRPEIAQAYSTFSANVPKLFVDLDREKSRTLDVPIDDVFQTLQAHLGSIYVNDLNLFGKVYRVMIQADADYRSIADDIGRLHVRTLGGEMVPLNTLVDVDTVLGPVLLNRYNLFRAATVTAVPAPGFSTGDAINVLQEEAVTALPPGYAYEWTGTAQQQLDAGGTVILVLLAAIVFGYLFLVGQYESWTMPLVILLSVTVALFGALAAVLTTGGDVNLYTQIGMIMLIGLASKNAILIVEFAMEQRSQGATVRDAALEAAKQRFRAVMMTALSFLLGVVPLLLASGAGAASQKAIGVAVFGGMLAATVIGVILIPVLYVLFQSLREWIKGSSQVRQEPAGD